MLCFVVIVIVIVVIVKSCIEYVMENNQQWHVLSLFELSFYIKASLVKWSNTQELNLNSCRAPIQLVELNSILAVDSCLDGHEDLS